MAMDCHRCAPSHHSQRPPLTTTITRKKREGKLKGTEALGRFLPPERSPKAAHPTGSPQRVHGHSRISWRWLRTSGMTDGPLRLGQSTTVFASSARRRSIATDEPIRSRRHGTSSSFCALRPCRSRTWRWRTTRSDAPSSAPAIVTPRGDGSATVTSMSRRPTVQRGRPTPPRSGARPL